MKKKYLFSHKIYFSPDKKNNKSLLILEYKMFTLMIFHSENFQLFKMMKNLPSIKECILKEVLYAIIVMGVVLYGSVSEKLSLKEKRKF